MRKLITVLAIMAMAGGAYAANIDQGTKELGLSGGVDFDSAVDTRIDFALSYGYFVRDAVELIGEVEVSDDDISTRYSFGGGAEYNWDLGSEWVPYAGASVLFSGTDKDVGGSDNAAVGKVSLGAKYFLRDSVAPYVAVDYKIASEDIYPELDGQVVKYSDDEVVISWGIRFYWD